MVATAVAGVNMASSLPALPGTSPRSTTPTLPDVLRRIEPGRPLQRLDALDANGDGSLALDDARVFERMARSLRRDAKSADPTQRPDLLRQARELAWAGQQARIGSSVPIDARNGATTIHNILPDTRQLTGQLGPQQVIAAIDSLDLTALRAAGVKPRAAFDLDGTSIKGDIFIPVMVEMARQERFGDDANTTFKAILASKAVDQKLVATNSASDNARLLVKLTRSDAKDGASDALSIKELFTTFGSSLKGQSKRQLQNLVRRVMEKGTDGYPPWKQQINDDSSAPGDSVRDMVGALKQKEIQPWVVTWGFDWIAKAAAPYLGISARNVVGSHSDLDGDRFTGATTTDSKHDMVVGSLKSAPIFVYGDSGSDAPMWDLAVGRGFIVNPTEAMQRLNGERGGDLAELRYRGTAGDSAKEAKIA